MASYFYGQAQRIWNLCLYLTVNVEGPGTSNHHVSDSLLVEPWNDSSYCQNLTVALREPGSLPWATAIQFNKA